MTRSQPPRTRPSALHDRRPRAGWLGAAAHSWCCGSRLSPAIRHLRRTGAKLAARPCLRHLLRKRLDALRHPGPRLPRFSGAHLPCYLDAATGQLCWLRPFSIWAPVSWWPGWLSLLAPQRPIARRTRGPVAGGDLSVRSELRGCAAYRGAGDLLTAAALIALVSACMPWTEAIQAAEAHSLEDAWFAGGLLVGLAHAGAAGKPAAARGAGAGPGRPLEAPSRLGQAGPRGSAHRGRPAAAPVAVGGAQLGRFHEVQFLAPRLCRLARRIHAPRLIRLDGHLAGALPRRLSGAVEHRQRSRRDRRHPGLRV